MGATTIAKVVTSLYLLVPLIGGQLLNSGPQLLQPSHVAQIIRDRYGIFRNPVLNRLNESMQADPIRNLLRDINFKYYNTQAEIVHTSPIRDSTDPEDYQCDPAGKFSIIVHGWNESCARPWVKDLVLNLHKYRGGCIMCMDYSPFARVRNYFRLVENFPGITRILGMKFEQMTRLGFSFDQGYLFGFSYGAQVVLRAARRHGHQAFKEIVACDPAGPGFDLIRATVDFRDAAQNVECIHTSVNLGTVHTTLCHQDWRMGECGIKQDAAGDLEFRSHGLCPLFYNSAFTHDFLAIEKPQQCKATHTATYWPEQFKMGYLERRKPLVNGELFAATTASYPYTTFNVTSEDVNHKEPAPLIQAEQEGYPDEEYYDDR